MELICRSAMKCQSEPVVEVNFKVFCQYGTDGANSSHRKYVQVFACRCAAKIARRPTKLGETLIFGGLRITSLSLEEGPTFDQNLIEVGTWVKFILYFERPCVYVSVNMCLCEQC